MAQGLRTFTVTTSDGVDLAVDDAGDFGAPALVFLHGIAQSRLAFRPLLTAPPSSLLGFRRVAFDLRGHGAGVSAALTAPQLQRELLAADVEAVLEALDLEGAVLVPWSYGGVVVGALLGAASGSTPKRVGGVIACAAAFRTGRAGAGLYGPAMLQTGKNLVTDEGDAYRAASRTFIAGCSARPLPAPVVEALVAEMSAVSLPVRRALLSGALDDSAVWRGASVPVGIVHGERDAVVDVAMSEALSTFLPQAPFVQLRGLGHLPWLEDADAFGDALSSVARALQH